MLVGLEGSLSWRIQDIVIVLRLELDFLTAVVWWKSGFIWHVVLVPQSCPTPCHPIVGVWGVVQIWVAFFPNPQALPPPPRPPHPGPCSLSGKYLLSTVKTISCPSLWPLIISDTSWGTGQRAEHASLGPSTTWEVCSDWSSYKWVSESMQTCQDDLKFNSPENRKVLWKVEIIV